MTGIRAFSICMGKGDESDSKCCDTDGLPWRQLIEAGPGDTAKKEAVKKAIQRMQDPCCAEAPAALEDDRKCCKFTTSGFVDILKKAHDSAAMSVNGAKCEVECGAGSMLTPGFVALTAAIVALNLM